MAPTVEKLKVRNNAPDLARCFNSKEGNECADRSGTTGGGECQLKTPEAAGPGASGDCRVAHIIGLWSQEPTSHIPRRFLPPPTTNSSLPPALSPSLIYYCRSLLLGPRIRNIKLYQTTVKTTKSAALKPRNTILPAACRRRTNSRQPFHNPAPPSTKHSQNDGHCEWSNFRGRGSAARPDP